MTQDWQPIETAPKDGREVLVWADLLFAGEELGRFNVARFYDDNWMICSDEYSVTPTHWMPLPEPPAHQEAEP